MPIHPPANPVTGRAIKQRVLLYGEEGEGKSYSHFSLADMLQRFGSQAQVFIIDTDGRTELTWMKLFPHLRNLHVQEVRNWAELTAAVDKVMSQVQPARGDVIVVDLWCRAWEMVQEHFVEKVFKHGLDEHLLEHRQKLLASEKKGGNAFDGMKDWPAIKGLFNRVANKVLITSKCDVILCCKAKTLDPDRDKADLVSKYQRVGFRPVGNKDTPFLVDTILWMGTKRVQGRVAYWMKSSKYTGPGGGERIDCEVNPVTFVDQAGQTQYAGGWAYQFLVGFEGWRAT